MSNEYAESKIREALKDTGGNVTLARQQVIAWAHEDARLLFALTRPHLNGIVAYQVERVASGRADAEKSQPDPAQDSEAYGGDFGRDILKAVVDNERGVFGHEDQEIVRKRGAVSQQHIDAIRQMAAKSTPKD